MVKQTFAKPVAIIQRTDRWTATAKLTEATATKRH